MKQYLKHRYFRRFAALLALDGLFFGLVNPRQASAVELIVGYLLFGATLAAAAWLTARSLKSYGDRPYKAAKRLLVYLVAAVFVLVGLQSVGQLTVRDAVTLAPLLIIAYLYRGYGRRAPAVE